MLPRIGITMGDPADIGNEIIANALTHEEIHTLCIPVSIANIRSTKAWLVQFTFDETVTCSGERL